MSRYPISYLAPHERCGCDRVEGAHGIGHPHLPPEPEPSTDLLGALRASVEAASPTRPCRNPGCSYRLSGGAAYCCAPCATADAQGYEIHGSGPLGHSVLCARREEQDR